MILNKTKKIVFLTGTRADFGKLKSLIRITQNNAQFETHIFATGMHMDTTYGFTVNEIYKSGFKNVFEFVNHNGDEHMDKTLAETISGFSNYIHQLQPDLIVVHGDRVEPMAGAIVGALNNILVAHIEGGELSGTVDELIRHAVSKLSHLHLVSNTQAKQRLLQMGEVESSVHVIGSPDLDLMNPDRLPDLDHVKNYYDIDFGSYAIVMFHPVTTEVDSIGDYTRELVEAVLASSKNYIVIYPNNDLGSQQILKVYKDFENHKNIKIFPSLRFEYFLRLLKEAEFIIGNSSAGVREAPYYNTLSINIGSRQHRRSQSDSIINVPYSAQSILEAINSKTVIHADEAHEFGQGNSDTLFLNLLMTEDMWKVDCQKQFQDLK